MPYTREELEAEARRLSRDDRVRLAEALISSLDEDSERDRAWVVELEGRLRELDEGRVEGIPGDDVLKELEDLLR